ncbi:hypothetical protein CDD82_7432 [Ophiocordyceps australis]|uniref:Peptidase A1 domain-containing protein n=1 Tax=Ophiocordyceps australis TaxID=1399860 RepID=A0A2C5YSD0_9HYPO|nr:hypothetical protein CDD82_7432 [Ophiocordyceps australis]
MALISLLTCLTLVVAEPKSATWSKTPIGPDGPWNAMEISVGGNQHPLLFYPGLRRQSFVIDHDYCSLNYSLDHCAVGGSYTRDESRDKALAGLETLDDARYILEGMPIEGGSTRTYTDSFKMNFGTEVIPDVLMGLVESQMIVYPGGSYVPFFAGCLSLGAENQTYPLAFPPGDKRTTINATNIPSYLYQNNYTPSISFALHLGSAASGSAVNGSLLFGGYDRRRVLGFVLENTGNFTFPILGDISIDSFDSTSPFPFSSRKNLLGYGDKPSPIQVTIDPCSPYLTLPRDSCSEIARWLPVTYNESLGLYLWKTEDPGYKRIVHSGSGLSFRLESETQYVNVKVPFQHLNLTLEPPLTEKPTPYFPCRPTDSTEYYTLGRAFLQDAFLAGDWANQEWWIAQAPGPNMPTHTFIQPIASNPVIQSDDVEWAATWNGLWTNYSNPHDQGSDPSSKNSLSTSAKIGIGVGAGVGGLALITGLIAFFRLRKPSSQVPPASQPANHGDKPPTTEPFANTMLELNGAQGQGSHYPPHYPTSPINMNHDMAMQQHTTHEPLPVYEAP